MTLTPFEMQREWEYRRQERLGSLAGAGEPTAEQLAIAKAEADAWRFAWLKKVNNEN